MTLESFTNYCSTKIGVEETFPFDKNTLVFKVFGKMFALADVLGFESINLKCDPEKSIDLRERYACVIPGYHMNKKHWNTVFINQDLSDKEIYDLIDHSYDLVFNSLPKKIRDGVEI